MKISHIIEEVSKYIPRFFRINATTRDKLTTIIEYEQIPKHTAMPNISYLLD